MYSLGYQLGGGNKKVKEYQGEKQDFLEIGISIGFISDNFKKSWISGIGYFCNVSEISDIV